jgi:hypothetical protein
MAHPRKKLTNYIMAKNICSITGANDGIGAKIAMAALAVGISFPTKASVTSGSSLKGKSRCCCAASRTGHLDLVTAPSMQDIVEICLPSVAFTPGGPLVYQWQKEGRSPIRAETPSTYDGRKRDRP